MTGYPNLWKRNLIQPRVRARADHQCEQCGMRFAPGTNQSLDRYRRDGHPIIGTVHHIDGNKQNCSMANLVYLCQSCHYLLHIYDWKPGDPLLLRWGGVPPRWIARRGIGWQPNP